MGRIPFLDNLVKALMVVLVGAAIGAVVVLWRKYKK